MEKTEKTSLCDFQKSPSLDEVNSKFNLPGCSDATDRDQSQPLMEIELPIKPVHLDHLHQKPSPMPLLDLEELPSTSSSDEAETEHQISDSKFKCPYCDKEFGIEKAMFGHMRIHSNRGSKDIRRTSGSEKKSESITDREIYTDHLQSKNWGTTKPRGCKPLIDRYSLDTLAAFGLMKMNRGGKIPPDLQKYYSSPEKDRKSAAIMEPTALNIGGRQEKAKKKVKSESHVCDVCGKSFPTGHQLGGHKRAHYIPPKDQHAAK